MKKLNTELENILIEAIENPEKRTKSFYEIGQKFLKPLQNRSLQEETYSIFEYMLEHANKWKSNLILPEDYRRSKEEIVFADIWFTVRDYFAWCVLYPDEVDQYFFMDENGQVQILSNPKVKILDKENKKDVYKSELGKQVLMQVKKDRSTLIKSGFTLGQKDEILTVCLVGLISLAHEYNSVKKVVKKVTAKQKLEAKSLIREFNLAKKLKLTLKEVNDLSLKLIDTEEITQESTKRLLEEYIKRKSD